MTRPLLLGCTALVLGCAGASRVTFIDSSRQPGRATYDRKIVDLRVDGSSCAHGVARIETHFTLVDGLIKALTMSLSQPRHAEVVCAEAER